MEKQEKIDWSQLTPEAAYKRIINFADKLMLTYPPLIFNGTTKYKFLWDRNSIYYYKGMVNTDHFFERLSDKAIVKMTKYSFLPDDQPIKLNDNR